MDIKINELYKIAYSVLTKCKIKDEDMLQAVVTRMSKALENYNEEKAKYSTFLYNVALNEVRNQIVYSKRKKRNGKEISLNKIVEAQLENEMTSSPLLADNSRENNVEKMFFKQKFFEEVEPYLSIETIMTIKGYNQKEISFMVNRSQQNISQIVRKDIDFLKKYCRKNKITYNDFFD